MPITYMAASLPRPVRQSRLSYLPLNCMIGSRFSRSDRGEITIFDVVMLRPPEFQRMKAYVALGHIVAPIPYGGPANHFVYSLKDIKELSVPDVEPHPESFARNFFIQHFDLVPFDAPSSYDNEETMREVEESFRAMIKQRNKKSP